MAPPWIPSEASIQNTARLRGTLFWSCIVVINLILFSQRTVHLIATDLERENELNNNKEGVPTAATRPPKLEVADLPVRDRPGPGKGRTAIVYVTRYVDDCHVERIEHLVRSAGRKDQNRDIWVLYNHLSFKDWKDPRIEDSKKFLEQLRMEHGVQSRSVSVVALPPFDSLVSRSAKSSFLRLIVDEDYDYGWHIEDDSFYTGDWSEVFDLEYGDADASFQLHQPENPWDWFNALTKKFCWVRKPNEDKRYDCQYTNPTAAFWFISKVSNDFARTLLYQLKTGHLSGHHEALIPSFATMYGFKIVDLRIQGNLVAGNWGIWQDAKDHHLEHHEDNKDATPIVPHALYHPVKCLAQDTPEKREFMRRHFSSDFDVSHNKQV